ncbi:MULTISPECIES: tRNA (adenosine(37)-N6)-threonylcarbamoyltransferase complex ATPase subunit type 1 TsaE [Dermacoccus]|uniref:tRNA (adenosine(37)-N6)-threonylcarbamoyltransferase complex ATPase subunit type 1 TsaE n=1 Tax=Dermacoccus TaxID=57495 RepID=UPI000641E2D4|nr:MULTISPECIES: tRNA (adenosine(37)-N6)-threonylcarbamoyltransferase complex ATPase subunit type 1 TsaE [Dermacoccus]KLO62470.1 hydrolase [Dermacoccus sp. PE3]MBE7370756.1 tRNA (adenosine(37)-N6)-threonylcarbamoyltransferase complex ATPase subunit type 1 TsaE [Dermacoccus barathri]MBZ4496606.1 tRNA (adenosine(37)-N6)-threonylcarbamoyltransferase complex ATPase subunit type 1 TsaE [Dermacoccus sp. Tok2021]QNK54002.1 tRNA (adenosine(37)-N6)-threonylcarbamoyltransferase complex ATPase subunit typ
MSDDLRLRGTRYLPDAEATADLGRALARIVRRGDVIVMTGDLGAGKTTTTRALGEALGVRGDVTSPTFVIAREHPSLGDGPALVHVDAYRLGGFGELDDLDLDTSLDDAVTVIEWGAGMAEALSDDRLHLTLTGLDDRTATIETAGERWADIDLASELGLD